MVVVVVKENLIFYPPQRTARALKGAQWDVMYRPPSAFALRTGRSAERSPNNGFSTHLFDQTNFTRSRWWCWWCVGEGYVSKEGHDHTTRTPLGEERGNELEEYLITSLERKPGREVGVVVHKIGINN